jgi:hypothetical protein
MFSKLLVSGIGCFSVEALEGGARESDIKSANGAGDDEDFADVMGHTVSCGAALRRFGCRCLLVENYAAGCDYTSVITALI